MCSSRFRSLEMRGSRRSHSTWAGRAAAARRQVGDRDEADRILFWYIDSERDPGKKRKTTRRMNEETALARHPEAAREAGTIERRDIQEALEGTWQANSGHGASEPRSGTVLSGLNPAVRLTAGPCLTLQRTRSSRSRLHLPSFVAEVEVHGLNLLRPQGRDPFKRRSLFLRQEFVQSVALNALGARPFAVAERFEIQVDDEDGGHCAGYCGANGRTGVASGPLKAAIKHGDAVVDQTDADFGDLKWNLGRLAEADKGMLPMSSTLHSSIAASRASRALITSSNISASRWKRSSNCTVMPVSTIDRRAETEACTELYLGFAPSAWPR